MEKAKFEALLPIIIADLMKKIVMRKRISHDEAFLRFYSSQLYIALDNEKTKVWHYSTDKLFELLEEEISEGKLELPEY